MVLSVATAFHIKSVGQNYVLSATVMGSYIDTGQSAVESMLINNEM